MRIGTWNLDAKWSDRHAAVLTDAGCDVWLLTEVPDSVAFAGYTAHRTEARMARGQHYAGILSALPMDLLPDPHPASAAVRAGELTFCSSVLPWASKDDPLVWGAGDQGERTLSAVQALAESLTPSVTIWGGDFNHALTGPTRWSGSSAGRTAISDFVVALELSVATTDLPHRLPGIMSIDHVGVPAAWTIVGATRIAVPAALSDHDAYVVTAHPRWEAHETATGTESDEPGRPG